MRNFIFLFLLLPLSAFAQDVKLLTWNVYMFPRPLMFTKQITRMNLMRKELPKGGHDVIVLQEAFSSIFRSRVGGALKKTHPYQTVLKRGGKGLKFLNSGVFVMSRWPFKVLDKENYNACAGIDCYAAKGVILIELEHPSGKKLQIASSHIQAMGDPKAQAARRAQFQVIADVLDRNRTEGVAQILAGDLNVNGYRTAEDSEYSEAVRILGMENGSLSGEHEYTSGHPIDCYRANVGRKAWLDHVLLRANGSSTTVESRRAVPFMAKIKKGTCPLSDHFGIEALIKL